MKVCPACDRTYHDDELNFCLMCGTSLVDGSSQPTVAISGGGEATVAIEARATMSEPKRQGPWFWIGVTLASIVGVTGLTFGCFFIYFFVTADTNRQYGPNRNTKNTDIAKTVVKPTPTPVASPSPDKTPEADSTPSPSDDAQVTPIAWNTTAVEFKGEDGDTLEFTCPENGTSVAVWGSDVYTEDSSICTAAVHAGVITLADGGEVIIEFRPGRSIYGSTTRNGITTNTFDEQERSFIVR